LIFISGQAKLATRDGQKTLAHKNAVGTMAICYACSQYRLRTDFSETQWKRPRQRDGNVPRSCNDCLGKGSVDDVLNWDAISTQGPGETYPFERKPPRPEKFRTNRSLDSLMDRSPDRDNRETQSSRNQEVDVMWKAREDRREKKKRKRGEYGAN